MWVWVKKNKKYIFLAVAAAAGAYAGGRYLMRKVSVLQQLQRSDELEGPRLREHLETNKQTCLSTIVGLVPSLRDGVMHHLNAEAITVQLRAKPANKLALWENLKVIGFTRLVVVVYACSMLTVFLRVQLSILGGCMLLDMKKIGSSEDTMPSSDIQKRYLSAVQHLLNEGMQSLVEKVRSAAEVTLLEYSLKHQLSCEGMLQLIREIRLQAAQPPARGSQPGGDKCFLLQFLLPKETLLETEDMLINATRDILESGDFNWVLERTVEQAFAALDRSATEAFHSAAQSSSLLPLARIIPLVCDHSQLLMGGHLQETSVGLLGQLLEAQELGELSENIYEAFSRA